MEGEGSRSGGVECSPASGCPLGLAPVGLRATAAAMATTGLLERSTWAEKDARGAASAPTAKGEDGALKDGQRRWQWRSLLCGLSPDARHARGAAGHGGHSTCEGGEAAQLKPRPALRS